MAKSAKKIQPGLVLKLTARLPIADLNPASVQAASENVAKVLQQVAELGFQELEHETKFGNMRSAAVASEANAGYVDTSGKIDTTNPGRTSGEGPAGGAALASPVEDDDPFLSARTRRGKG